MNNVGNEIPFVQMGDISNPIDQPRVVSSESEEAGCSSLCSAIGKSLSNLADSIIESKINTIYKMKADKVYSHIRPKAVELPNSSKALVRFNMTYSHRVNQMAAESEALRSASLAKKREEEAAASS